MLVSRERYTYKSYLARFLKKWKLSCKTSAYPTVFEGFLKTSWLSYKTLPYPMFISRTANDSPAYPIVILQDSEIHFGSHARFLHLQRIYCKTSTIRRLSAKVVYPIVILHDYWLYKNCLASFKDYLRNILPDSTICGVYLEDSCICVVI